MSEDVADGDLLLATTCATIAYTVYSLSLLGHASWKTGR